MYTSIIRLEVPL